MSGSWAEHAVIHDSAAQVFRIGAGADAAVLEYRLAAGRITFLHTFVPESLRGKGVAQRLARAGLEHAKADALRVVPICPFVQAYLRGHREFQPLVES